MKNINEMISDILERCNRLISSTLSMKNSECSKEDACSRLKLVLMQDRSGLSQDLLTKMKDELVEVISRYVEIDREALDLNLANEGNSLALVASIPVVRSKPEKVAASVVEEEENNDDAVEEEDVIEAEQGAVETCEAEVEPETDEGTVVEVAVQKAEVETTVTSHKK